MHDPIIPHMQNANTEEELQKVSHIVSTFAPDVMKFGAWLRGLISVLLGWLSAPLDMLRVEHGERTLSPLRIFNALLVIKLFWLVVSLAAVAFGQALSTQGLTGVVKVPLGGFSPPAWFQTAFLLAGALHLWRISYRRRAGIRIHSMAAGVSILEFIGVLDWVNFLLGSFTLLGRWTIPFRLNRWHLYLYIEPLIGALIAHALQAHDPIFSAWLWLSTGSLFIRNHLMAAQQRHTLLDYWDSQLNAEFLQAAAEQSPPSETAGIMVLPGFAEVFAHADKLDIDRRVRETLQSTENGAE